MPALDLIQNYCADTDPNPEPMPALIAVPANDPNDPNEEDDDDDDDDDDDIFQLIQVELVHEDCVPK